ncbi:MAG TPA: hypothetical protein VHY58_06885 [Streptosporangiaceae bacterium]|nr:hypothetical protein [Streptosporangiaceae bacterium]
MISGAGEAIFAVARTAGWTAHALEEYTRATPLRPRAVCTGPPPPPPPLPSPLPSPPSPPPPS